MGIPGPVVVLFALAYTGGLFALAWYGDRQARSKATLQRPNIYALAIAVYCTSWTFYGSVGLAASSGFAFLAVYIGPCIMFLLGWRLLRRIVHLSKSQNITSVADFIAARYGKSQGLGALVAVIAVIGSLPYIALQLKAVSVSVDTLLGPGQLRVIELGGSSYGDTAFIVALAMAAFAWLFGTRHADATEHQEGLMLAIAAESLVKVAAFVTVGLFVVYGLNGGFLDLYAKVQTNAAVHAMFSGSGPASNLLAITLLSLVCIVLLPRQFHVAVVENHTDREIQRARWMFPAYLVLINLFVVPIAAAGLLLLPSGSFKEDMYVLQLPLTAGYESAAVWAFSIAVVAFLGGLSAATAMVIVDSVALSIMVCNDLVLPVLLYRRFARFFKPGSSSEFTQLLLRIRRIAILVILLLGYACYHILAGATGLANIGLISFAAFAQFAPAFFLGLIWHGGTARGAIAGILAGFGVWSYTLLLPWIVKAGLIGNSIMIDGPFGIGFLRPDHLFGTDALLEPLAHGVVWSLLANTAVFYIVSRLQAPSEVERAQARLFIEKDMQLRPEQTPPPGWRYGVTNEELQQAVARYVGAERTQRSFDKFASDHHTTLAPGAEADQRVQQYAERLLASAIGTSSARVVVSALFLRKQTGSRSSLEIIETVEAAAKFNRDQLQAALDEVRHGIAVFDCDGRLQNWNRQFRKLLGLEASYGRIGVSLEELLRASNLEIHADPARIEERIGDYRRRIAVSNEPFVAKALDGSCVLEVMSNAVPSGGFVATFTDITDRANASLARENLIHALEERFSQRSAELIGYAQEAAELKKRADQANLDKTRFLAAASHDLLQPLNAARIYATALSERAIPDADKDLSRRISTSLEAVEEIMSSLMEISRLDGGRLQPDFTAMPLQEIFDQLESDFSAIASRKGLRLRVARTEVWVWSDRRMLRRLLQNLVSNAIKYTAKGSVLLGCRLRGDQIVVQVCDTGPGIAPDKLAVVFREFVRLDDARHQAGLGLGLSIVERIARVLRHQIRVDSAVGAGSVFSVALDRVEPQPQIVAPPAPSAAAAIGGRISGLAVLCIDNDERVLDSMRLLLSQWGCRVLIGRSANEALRQIEQHRALPDLILADYHLDDDAVGLDAVDTVIRTIKREIPACIITADHSAEVAAEARARGFSLLRKPVKGGALRAMLESASRQRQAAE